MKSFSVYMAIALSVVLATATPTVVQEQKHGLARRDAPVHCVDDAVDGPKTVGNLLCIDSTGTVQGCDVCMESGSASNGYTCYITTGSSDELGNYTACPQDPPPSTYPNGTDATSLGATIVNDFCTIAGAVAPGDFVTFAACFAWGWISNGGASQYEELQAGAEILCDTLTLGLCACIETGFCSTNPGGS